MYLKKYINTIKAEPLVFLIGVCVLLLAVMGTSVHHVSSSMFAILFLLSFLAVKDWLKVYKSLSKLEKAFVFSFIFYMVSGLLSFYNADDVGEYVRLFERYMRYFVIIPVYFLIILNNKSVLNYLFTGAVISGPFLSTIALLHYFDNPDVPAQGHYHHIIFGQLAMLNVGIMLIIILSKNLSCKIQFVILFSMACGVMTAVMSQARGVWLVFPIYAFVAIYFSIKDKRLSTKSVIGILIVAILLLVMTPVGNLIKKRTESAVEEVTSFYTKDRYATSVGGRLAMWDIAVDVWQKAPILGTGPGDFDDEIVLLQKKGEYRGMAVHNSVHNIYIQALVGSGLIGLIALLLATVVMPLKLYLNKNQCNEEGRLAGLITVISFAVFGFSESWTLRLPSVSIFLVYTVVIASHIRIMCLQKNSVPEYI